MMIMAGSIDLITAFVGLETMAVSFYILAGFIKPNQRSNEAAVKYFLLGAFSLGILLYGMSILYGVSGTTNLRGMATVLVGHDRDPMVVLAVILVVAGMGFKIAAGPFHMWAPDVYEGAPTPVTAFLSVGSKAASFAMLLRIFFEGLPSMSADWTLLFEVLAIVTMTVGNVAALTQTNLKRMLAYSSIAHAGYLLIGVVVNTPRGTSAMLIYLMTYSFMQLGAFAVIIMLRRKDVVGDDLKDLSGLSFRQPFAAFAMLLFMLSLGGIPPTAGFMGKLWLFGAAIDAHYYWLAVIGVLNSAISLYYYLRVDFGHRRSGHPGARGVPPPAVRTGGDVGADVGRERRDRGAAVSGPARAAGNGGSELFHNIRYTHALAARAAVATCAAQAIMACLPHA
jgi:NADH-quinone oxidoreductase subunit N